MALPTSYLTSTKNVEGILDAIRKGQAPKRFTQKYLETLGYRSAADRLFINVLKALGFLNEKGEPQQRYHEYLDPTQSKRVLAEGIRDAYADLFQINTKAYEMTGADVKNKLKTLSQGQHGDAVLQKMASTFKQLAKYADFTIGARPKPEEKPSEREAEKGEEAPRTLLEEPGIPPRIGGLVYSIQINLPESRDPAVYDALFKSLKEHLLS